MDITTYLIYVIKFVEGDKIMSELRQNHPLLFNHQPELSVTEKTYSIHSLNPFSRHLSSPRGQMMATHMAQTVPIYNGETKILQTGIELQMSKSSYSIVVQESCRVVGIVKNKVAGDEYPTATVIITVRDDEDGSKLFDIITIKPYEILANGFGFMYNIDYDLINSLYPGHILEKGQILAKSPTHGNDDQWRFGINANLALVSLPEVAEDGIVMSKSLANRLRYDYFEVKHIEFGKTVMPLNMYGDNETYKVIPDILEEPRNQMLCVLRKIGVLNVDSPDILDTDVLMASRSYMRNPDTEFDIGYFLSAPVDKNNKPYVIDVNVYKSSDTNYSDLIDKEASLGKYMFSKRQFYNDVMRVYQNEIVSRYRNDFKVSPKLSELLIDASYNINEVPKVLQFKGKDIDAYHLEIVTRSPGVCSVGSKCSDLHGSKGIIIEIRDDEYMPYTIDKYGNKIVADIIMDPISVVSRMNPSRVYEQFFNDASRKCQALLRSMVKNRHKPTANEIELCFNTLLEFFALFGTEQYTHYLSVKDDVAAKKEIVLEALNQEVYIYYKVSTEKRPIEVVMDVISGSKFNPELLDTYMKDMTTGEVKKFREKIRIAPIYEILLNRRSDRFLATNIARINHHGFPISTSGNTKNKLMWKHNPVRLLSETDVRLYNAYGSSELLAELRDRSLSQVTVREIYTNLLSADNPTNVNILVEREKVPYGEDAALHKLDNFLAAIGSRLKYIAK